MRKIIVQAIINGTVINADSPSPLKNAIKGIAMIIAKAPAIFSHILSLL
jgi:hypothetical protein